MTTDEVIRELAVRGFTLVLEDGLPRLAGNKGMLTPALRKVLHWHREGIIRHLQSLPQTYRPRQWLWTSGHRYTETPDDLHWQKPDTHSPGAWWYRHGGGAWKAVPGTPGADSMHRIEECANRPPIRRKEDYAHAQQG